MHLNCINENMEVNLTIRFESMRKPNKITHYIKKNRTPVVKITLNTEIAIILQPLAKI